jgi:hypothetical protein
MGQEIEYWKIVGYNPATHEYKIGVGSTFKEATEKCIQNIKRHK